MSYELLQNVNEQDEEKDCAIMFLDYMSYPTQRIYLYMHNIHPTVPYYYYREPRKEEKNCKN